MVQGKGNPMVEEWDCKGGKKVEGRREGSRSETESGRIRVAFRENRGSNKAGRKQGARGSDQEGI